MPVDKISFEYTRKLNLGNFESQVVGVNVWYDVDEGEDPQEAFDGIAEFAKENVRKRALDLLRQTKGYMVVDMTGQVVSHHPFFVVENELEPSEVEPEPADAPETA